MFCRSRTYLTQIHAYPVRAGIAALAILSGSAVLLAWQMRVAETSLPQVCSQVDDKPSRPQSGMVKVTGGIFAMGSEDFRAEEAPVINATVGSFWIDAHDVTNAQFERFVREAGYATVAERWNGGNPPGAFVFKPPIDAVELADPSRWWRFVEGANWRHPEGPGSDITRRRWHPVVQIAYEDAEAYAHWSNRALPTEAQWEYAARGGFSGQAYTWGNEPDTADEPKANNWRGVFPVLNLGTNGFKGTSPVGCFPPNAYGLYDMAGNVWQWTRDSWTSDHHRPASAINAIDANNVRVIKGGSFLCATNFCLRYRPAARQPGESAVGASHIGFRTVLEAPMP